MRTHKLTQLLTGFLLLLLTTIVVPGHANWVIKRTQPDYYTVTAIGYYRPVAQPGTQRRLAQNEAEEKARKQILEYVGKMRAPRGETLNVAMSKNEMLRSVVLQTVRNSELVDWKVFPACGQVQVWVRLDLNEIREALGQPPAGE